VSCSLCTETSSVNEVTGNISESVQGGQPGLDLYNLVAGTCSWLEHVPATL